MSFIFLLLLPVQNSSEGNVGLLTNATSSSSPEDGDGLSPSTSSDTVTTSSIAPNSISIPAQVSIPVQFQNGGMGSMDITQQMSDLDLNVHCPSPLQPGSSAVTVGMPPRQGGMVEFSPRSRGSGGFSGSQNYSGTPIMYSDNYPQGALYMGSSNPMMASWQYNPSTHSNQGMK